jgi:hypothetical protein
VDISRTCRHVRYIGQSLQNSLDACFIVEDNAGQKLAYVYFEDEPGRRSAAKLLTRDEAWRIAENLKSLFSRLERPRPDRSSCA